MRKNEGLGFWVLRNFEFWELVEDEEFEWDRGEMVLDKKELGVGSVIEVMEESILRSG